MFLNRSLKNLKRLAPWVKREGITCYRIYDRDIPEIPFAVDLYEKALHVSVYSRNNPTGALEDPRVLLNPLADRLDISQSNVFIKERKRQRGGSQYERVSNRSAHFVVNESGYKFRVNLTDYLDTGLFLDHRRLRNMVGDSARGKHVLNLFAYTGAFTVYSAGGGAASTTTVDLSNTYLDWAIDNLELNGLRAPQNQMIQGDVQHFLTNHAPPDGGYDLVVIDAPTISRSKRMEEMFDVQKDHPAVLNGILALCKTGATVYFASNFRKFRLASDEIKDATIEEISSQTIPFDFRDRNVHRCFKLIRV